MFSTMISDSNTHSRLMTWLGKSLPSPPKLAAIAGGVYCASKLFHALNSRQKAIQHKKIEAVGQQHKITRDERIRSLQIPLTPHIDAQTLEAILNASVSILRDMLQSGKVTSEDLVNIFSLRCQSIGLELYAITEMDYLHAIEQARQIDRLIQSERTLLKQCTTPQNMSSSKNNSLFDLKPLLGIPISIKDTFEMKGFACTTGCIQRKDMLCDDDGLILKLIRDAGGIPFVRTNVPQLGMSIECMNRLYGRALNPWDKKRYPGGSSGGEAILLATRSSPLGLGTDFGGSVRTPACINGICAFKPTNGRVPQKGLGISANTTVGQLVIRTTLGPMAKHVDDLAIAMRVLLNDDFVAKQSISIRGAYTQVVKFDQAEYTNKSKKFRIGYFKSLNYFEACAAQQRAVSMAVDALEREGHELVEIEFPFEKVLYMVYYQILSSDNNAKYSDILGEEDYVQEYAGFKYYMTEASSLTKNAITTLLKFLKEHRSADLLDWCKVNRSAEEYMAINGQLVKLREEVSAYLENLGIEAVLSPGLGVPAFEHGSSPRFIICTIYSLIWNVLNYPSGVVPVTTIREDEQKYESRIQDKITKQLNEEMKKNTAGLPMGVQITSYPFKDEICLNIMKDIETQIDFYATTPLPY